ncbi:endonuclease III [Candidatus Gracilibacteria bacterium]|nr:endonuclease III [Candidatus Gracilibacteria bacterium]
MKETKTQRKSRTGEIIELLASRYPEPKTALNYHNTFELLVATVLSAQTTDKRVNIVTPTFFPEHDSAEKLLRIGEKNFSEMIRTIGLYRSKAKNVIRLCQQLVDHHQGEVPNNREALESLPGVGRKTANVVLSNAFGVPAFAVDTHVFRVTHRLGLSQGKTPLVIEQDLTALLPKDQWSYAHHYFIFLGREICKAPNPLCAQCPLTKLCPSSRA